MLFIFKYDVFIRLAASAAVHPQSSVVDVDFGIELSAADHFVRLVQPVQYLHTFQENYNYKKKKKKKKKKK